MKKVVRKGYKEVERLPDAEVEDAEVIPPEVEQFRRPGWLPRLGGAGGAPAGSRLGGLPWLATGDEWPTLSGAHVPLLLQLRLDELPELGLGGGLLQVFYEQGDESWDDWEPWTPTKYIRVTSVESGALASGDSPDGPWPRRLITGFERVDELPDAETLRLYGIRLSAGLEAHLREFERPRSGFKIGGWPHWLQGVDYPRCMKTRFPCRFLLQLDSNDGFVTFGDAGVAHVFQSPAFPELMTMTWQSC